MDDFCPQRLQGCLEDYFQDIKKAAFTNVHVYEYWHNEPCLHQNFGWLSAVFKDACKGNKTFPLPAVWIQVRNMVIWFILYQFKMKSEGNWAVGTEGTFKTFWE